MATFNISVLSSSGTSNGYRFSGSDKNGSINSSTNNPTINVNAGDTINFTFYNSTSHPFKINGTSITGNSATGGYYSSPTTASYTFSLISDPLTLAWTYVCNVHSSMTGSIISASIVSTTTSAPTTTSTTTTAAPTTTTSTTTTSTTAPTTVAPTTVAPTTTAPTTAAPTTVAPIISTPTTAAPTTVAPTTTTAAPIILPPLDLSVSNNQEDGVKRPDPDVIPTIPVVATTTIAPSLDRQTFTMTVAEGLKVEVDSSNRPLPVSEWLRTLVVSGSDRDGPISQQLDHIDWGGNPITEYNGTPIIGYHQIIKVNAYDIINWFMPRFLMTPRAADLPNTWNTNELELITVSDRSTLEGWSLQIGTPTEGFESRLQAQSYYRNNGLDIESAFPSLGRTDGGYNYMLINIIDQMPNWVTFCGDESARGDVIYASPMGGCDPCNDVSPELYGDDWFESRRYFWQGDGVGTSALYSTEMGPYGNRYFTCFPRFCNGSSSTENNDIVFDRNPFVLVRPRLTVSGPNTDVTTTSPPCIENEDDIPRDVPEKVNLEYQSGSITLPVGDKIKLKIENKEYNLLHDRFVSLQGGQKFVSVAKITSNNPVNFSEIKILFEDEINISGKVNISLKSHEGGIVFATKTITGKLTEVKLDCSDILQTIDLQNIQVLVIFQSVCEAIQEDCCETLSCIQLFDQINNFCIDDPCQIVMPNIVFFSTKEDTRLILHDGNYVVLDTGYVNTNTDNISDHISYQGDDVVFTNHLGNSYILDYYPAVISNLSNLSGTDCDRHVENKTDLYRYKCFDFTSDVSNTQTWVFPFDICDLTACVNPNGYIPPPEPQPDRRPLV